MADEEATDDVWVESVENARKWDLLAKAIGYNELAKLGKTLGEKAYARMARDRAAKSYEEVTGLTGLFAKTESTVEIPVPGSMLHIRFGEQDIDLMRAAIAQYDSERGVVVGATHDERTCINCRGGGK